MAGSYHQVMKNFVAKKNLIFFCLRIFIIGASLIISGLVDNTIQIFIR